MSFAIINYTAGNTPGHRYEVCLWYTVHNNNNDKCIINIRIWDKSAKIRRQVFTSPSCTHLKEACYGFAHLMVENSLQHLNCLGPQREGWRQNVLLENHTLFNCQAPPFVFSHGVSIFISASICNCSNWIMLHAPDSNCMTDEAPHTFILQWNNIQRSLLRASGSVHTLTVIQNIFITVKWFCKQRSRYSLSL